MRRVPQSIGLSTDVCDVNGCMNVATHTDGEYVQCAGHHHEPEVYRSMHPWVPIELEYRDSWPYVVAWFRRDVA